LVRILEATPKLIFTGAATNGGSFTAMRILSAKHHAYSMSVSGRLMRDSSQLNLPKML